MEAARKKNLAYIEEAQPANTKSAYAGPQRLWHEWCERRQFSDGNAVESKKLILFIDEVVSTRRVIKKKKRNIHIKKEKEEEEEEEKKEEKEDIYKIIK